MTEAALPAEMIIDEIRDFRRTALSGIVSLIVVVNKTDLVNEAKVNELREKIQLEPEIRILFMSAANTHGYSLLKTILTEVAGVTSLEDNMVVITNSRHYEALLRITESIDRVKQGIESNTPSDLIALDTRQAIHYLGEITGEISTDEILGNIFRNFCIGK
jgi:tRNA modification GTPase